MTNLSMPKNSPTLLFDWGERTPPVITYNPIGAIEGYVSRAKALMLCGEKSEKSARAQYDIGKQFAEYGGVSSAYPPFPKYTLEDFMDNEHIRPLSEKISRCMNMVQLALDIGSSEAARREYDFGKSMTAEIDSSVEFPQFPTRWDLRNELSKRGLEIRHESERTHLEVTDAISRVS